MVSHSLKKPCVVPLIQFITPELNRCALSVNLTQRYKKIKNPLTSPSIPASPFMDDGAATFERARVYNKWNNS